MDPLPPLTSHNLGGGADGLQLPISVEQALTDFDPERV
jgi:hypothetical protein